MPPQESLPIRSHSRAFPTRTRIATKVLFAKGRFLSQFMPIGHKKLAVPECSSNVPVPTMFLTLNKAACQATRSATVRTEGQLKGTSPRAEDHRKPEHAIES